MVPPLEELVSALQFSFFPIQVLLVEDDDSTRSALQRVLEHEGYRVLASENADRALQLLRQTHVAVDLLVTDVQMPGIQGDALVRRVREAWPDLPVLFISGEPRFAEMPDQAGGRSRFLLKPFSPGELIGRVREILGVPGDAAEVSAPG
jgi:two-component system, cell cycle sensor histidine kinase and response regulator CckA